MELVIWGLVLAAIGIVIWIFWWRNSRDASLESQTANRALESFLDRNLDTRLINLARSRDRLDRCTQHFADIGLPFRRFEAVDGASAKTHDGVCAAAGVSRLPCLYHPDNPEHGARNLACYMSHFGVLREAALENAKPWTLVCEDDLMFTGPHVKDRIARAILDNADKDLIWLNWHATKWTCPPGSLTEAYVVSRKGASKLASLLDPDSQWSRNYRATCGRDCLYDWNLHDIMTHQPPPENAEITQIGAERPPAAESERPKPRFRFACVKLAKQRVLRSTINT